MKKLVKVFSWLGNLRVMDRRKVKEVEVEKLVDPQGVLEALVKQNESMRQIDPSIHINNIMYDAGKKEILRGLKTLIKRNG